MKRSAKQQLRQPAALKPRGFRWTASRKEAIVLEVLHGKTSREQAIAYHGLTEEEFDSWDRRFARHGRRALKQTQIQQARP